MTGLPWLQSYFAVTVASRFQNPIFIMGIMAIYSRILLKESPAALGLFLASALMGAWTVPEPEEDIAHVAAHSFIIYVVGAFLEFSWWITGLLLVSTDFVVFLTQSENLPRKFALLVPGFVYTAYNMYGVAGGGYTSGICDYIYSIELPQFLQFLVHTNLIVTADKYDAADKSAAFKDDTNFIIALCYLMVVTGALIKMKFGRPGAAVALANDKNEERDEKDGENKRNQG
jgi:hypothetical protein